MASKHGRETETHASSAGGGIAEAPHLSRLLAVEDIPETGLQITIEADAAERAAIAKSDGLVGVDRLEAELSVRKMGHANVNVAGPMKAFITQTCVVSLEPFDSEINCDIDVDFAPTAEAAASAREAEHFIASSQPTRDPPDPIIDGHIDLGALVEEFLALNLDPYPRKPGAEFDESRFSNRESDRTSPFAALKELKK